MLNDESPRGQGDPDLESRSVELSVPRDVSGIDLDFFGNSPRFTPEIERACQVVAHWVRCDIPGGFIHGLQRLGKTQCALYIQQAVPMMLGATAIAKCINACDRNQKVEEFLRDMLRQFGNPAIGLQKQSHLHARVVDTALNLCSATGARRLVLIIDEAQRLSQDHLMRLMLITDEIARMGVRTFVLQVGQPELKTQLQTLAGNCVLQLTGRFFSVSHEFMGINVEDLEKMIEAMDGEPESTVFEVYLPERRARGQSLVDVAAPMKQALIEFGVELGAKSVRIPMQWARSALTTLLYRLIGESGHAVEINVELVKDCLAEVGFLAVMKSYVLSER